MLFACVFNVATLTTLTFSMVSADNSEVMLFREAVQEEIGTEDAHPNRKVMVPLFRPNASVVPRMLDGSIVYAKSMVEAHRNLYPNSKAEYSLCCGGVLMFVSPNSPLTQTLSFGVSQPVSAEDLEFARDFFVSRGAEFRFRLTPFTHPTLFDSIASLQLTFEGTGVQVFLPLTHAPVAEPSGIETRPIEKQEEWLKLFSAAFYGGGFNPDIEELGLTIFHSHRTHILGAWIDGKLAGGATVSFHNQLASLNAACTLPEFRGRGIQKALIKTRLAMALENNCNMAMSSVTPASISLHNYLREGFEIAYFTTLFRTSASPKTT